MSCFFFFNDTATTEIYTLSLHDALPIYFPEDFLLVIDESHVTVPQIGGMYEGDMSRKRTLVDHGFRLPSAMDNRPLRWERSEEHTSELQSRQYLVCRLLLEKKKKTITN